MPVTTRSQCNSAIKFALPKPAHSYAEVAKNKFIMHVKKLLHYCEKARGEENKMRVVLETFKYTNKELPEIIQKTSEKLWINFAALVFIKSIDIENEYNNLSSENKRVIDKTLVKNLNAELRIARRFVTTLVKNNWNLSSEPIFIQAKEYISKIEIANNRPRRSVKPVDYTGMDSIEVECDSGETITIWDDFTKEYDPDYEFER
jgi:hypothetical protein